jgi:hypothetical protein
MSKRKRTFAILDKHTITEQERVFVKKYVSSLLHHKSELEKSLQQKNQKKKRGRRSKRITRFKEGGVSNSN